MKLFSPAKINLFLRVLNRRHDGYHQVATLVQAIDFGDILNFTLSDADSLICNNPDVPSDSSNLIFKAADLFRRKTGLRFGLKVELEKKIPLEAGLGGGSSNAATTLFALNTIYGYPFSIGELMDLATELGHADITLFFSSGTAYCEGIGENVHSLDPFLENPSLWIVKPEAGLSTPLVYRTLNLEECAKINPQILLEQFQSGTIALYNDLEKPAMRLLPELAALKQKLLASGCSNVSMTGSGTAFICVSEKQPAPESFKIHFLNREKDQWYEFS